MHVSLHQLRDDVDILEASLRGWLGHIEHLDDVLVVEEFEQADLSHDSFRIDQVLKGFRHLLNGNLLV